MEWNVPLFDLDYGPEEAAAVSAVLESKWLTMGSRTALFEERFARFTGARHAIAVANGTAALHLGLLCAGVGPGDEVLVPDITFIASANAAVYAGADAVLVDVIGPHDLTIDPLDLERKITPRTKAVVVVHLAGQPCLMDQIMALAREHGLAVVEDCAHAPGAYHAGVHLGRIGAVGCFSFFSNKNLSTGEGGMVITDDDERAEQVRAMRSHGLTSSTAVRHDGHVWGYDITTLGFNYRMSEIEAALGVVQLGKLAENNRLRAEVAASYESLVATAAPGVVLPFSADAAPRPPGSASSHHVQIAVLPEGASNARTAAVMAARGIQTSYHYRPIHTFSSPHIQAMRAEGLDVAGSLRDRIITLPLYPAMTRSDVEVVVGALAAGLDA